MELGSYFAGERGRASRLAKILGESPSFLSQVATGRRACPAMLAVSIEQATDGVVTRCDLRPADWHLIWPELVNDPAAPPIPNEAS